MSDNLTQEAARRDLGKMLVPKSNAHLLVDVDKQEESVRSESTAIREFLEQRKPNAMEIAIGEIDFERFWALRRQFSNSLRATGLTKRNEAVVVPRSHLVNLIAFAETIHINYEFTM